MQTTELHDLEAEIDNLLQSVDQYRTEIKSLRHQMTTINRERIRLKEQNQLAAKKIKRLITQLKEEVS